MQRKKGRHPQRFYQMEKTRLGLLSVILLSCAHSRSTGRQTCLGGRIHCLDTGLDFSSPAPVCVSQCTHVCIYVCVHACMHASARIHGQMRVSVYPCIVTCASRSSVFLVVHSRFFPVLDGVSVLCHWSIRSIRRKDSRLSNCILHKSFEGRRSRRTPRLDSLRRLPTGRHTGGKNPLSISAKTNAEDQGGGVKKKKKRRRRRRGRSVRQSHGESTEVPQCKKENPDVRGISVSRT